MQVKLWHARRIDATRLFNGRLFALLLVKANMARALWDRQVIIYHNGLLAQTDKSLSEILLSIKHAEDSSPQQPLVGYMLAMLSSGAMLMMALLLLAMWDGILTSSPIVSFSSLRAPSKLFMQPRALAGMVRNH